MDNVRDAKGEPVGLSPCANYDLLK